MSPLALSASQLKALAHGLGDRDVIDVLRDGQYNRFLMTLATILGSVREVLTADAVALLGRAQQNDPGAYREMMMNPQVGMWASAFLTRIVEGCTDELITQDARHLASIAAVTAWRCGIDEFEIETTMTSDGVVLPSMGRAFPAGEIGSVVTLSMSVGRFSVRTGEHTVTVPENPHCNADWWEGIREVVVVSPDGPTLRLTIDDIDPYRNTFASAAWAPPSRRLDDIDLKLWHEVITDAWLLLCKLHPQYAIGMSVGLQAIVPLVDETNARRHEHHDDVFGAIAMTRPPSALWFAQSMMEEFQRMKLTALHYLSPLHTGIPADRRYEVPWTHYPVSLGRVIEGLYALPPVAEFWADQAELGADEEERFNAKLDFVRWRSWIDGVRPRVIRSGELTELGRRFLAELPTADSLPVQDIPLDIRALARRIQIDFSLCWRIENLVPDPVVIEQLAGLWTMGGTCPSAANGLTWSVETSEYWIPGWVVRRRLGVLAQSEPQKYALLALNASHRELFEPASSDIDFLLVDGAFAEVIDRSCAALINDPNDLDAWAALAVASALQQEQHMHTIGRFPEVVRALQAAVFRLHQQHVDPRELSMWAAPLLAHLDNEAFETDNPYELRRRS